MNNLPVRVNPKYFSLAGIGVNAQSYKLTKVGFCSGRGIGVSDTTTDGQQRYTFVDFENNFQVETKANQSDSGLPHPTRKVTAFRKNVNGNVPTVVQIFDLGASPP